MREPTLQKIPSERTDQISADTEKLSKRDLSGEPIAVKPSWCKQLFTRFKGDKLYNPVLLMFDNPFDKELYRLSKHSRNLYIWLVYSVIDGGFTFYLISLTLNN